MEIFITYLVKSIIITGMFFLSQTLSNYHKINAYMESVGVNFTTGRKILMAVVNIVFSLIFFALFEFYVWWSNLNR